MQRLKRWYEGWRPNTHTQLRQRTNGLMADAALFVPDVLMLLVGLLSDNRISAWQKAYVSFLLLYILSPLDIVPEFVLGMFGLVDDATVLGIMMLALTSTEQDIVQQHWYGNRAALDRAASLLRQVTRLRRWISPVRGVRALLGREKNKPQTP
ncbi:MAG: DUF1232 domain-containing protein [Anaerolineae bacterium]|nr:DUF1232 domain-containing protein [Anaerolineae bacterium]